jgi:hypothetical protein
MCGHFTDVYFCSDFRNSLPACVQLVAIHNTIGYILVVRAIAVAAGLLGLLAAHVQSISSREKYYMR